VDDVVFVNDLVNFECKLTAEGIEGPAVLRLKQKGIETPLSQQTVTIPKGGGVQSVRLAYRPEKKGEYEFILEVRPQAGEVNTENNAISRTVHVTEEVIRVLLVQATPSYEFRFLKTMLERELNRDEGADSKDRGFRTVLQEADPAYVDTDKSAERIFPVSREELFRYDVLILADMNPTFLSPSVMNHIYEFVTVRGGGVIFVAGPKYMPLAFANTPLAPLLPMEIDSAQVPDPATPITESFHPRVTPLGLASPTMQLADNAGQNRQLWQEGLPPLRWLVTVGDLRPGVRVLAEHPTKKAADGNAAPLITLQFIGAGKVVFHATDETHRWRFRVGDVYFARYWVQTIRYLSRAKLLGGSRSAELTADRQEYRRGDVVRLRVRFLDDRLAPPQDDGVTVVLERERSRRVNLTLRRDATNRGIFEGTAGDLADGKYRAWMASPTLEGQPPRTEFVITSPPGELARLQMDAAEMQQAAKASGGKFFRYSDADQLLSSLPKGRQVRIESLPPQPLWNAPLLAAAFVALLTGEWLLRSGGAGIIAERMTNDQVPMTNGNHRHWSLGLGHWSFGKVAAQQTEFDRHAPPPPAARRCRGASRSSAAVVLRPGVFRAGGGGHHRGVVAGGLFIASARSGAAVDPLAGGRRGTGLGRASVGCPGARRSPQSGRGGPADRDAIPRAGQAPFQRDCVPVAIG
jgi:hypothetical protein